MSMLDYRRVIFAAFDCVELSFLKHKRERERAYR